MLCTVYYAASDEVRFTVPSPFTVAQAASGGSYRAVVVLEAGDSEQVFDRIQNLEESWWKNESFIGSHLVHGDKRSMSVGDIIVWSDGKTEIVAGFGFQKLPSLIGKRLHDAADREERRKGERPLASMEQLAKLIAQRNKPTDDHGK